MGKAPPVMPPLLPPLRVMDVTKQPERAFKANKVVIITTTQRRRRRQKISQDVSAAAAAADCSQLHSPLWLAQTSLVYWQLVVRMRAATFQFVQIVPVFCGGHCRRRRRRFVTSVFAEPDRSSVATQCIAVIVLRFNLEIDG